MRFNERQVQAHQYMLQGLLVGLLPLVMLSADVRNDLLPGYSNMAAGIIAALLQIAGAGMIFRHRIAGRMLMVIGVLFCTLTIWQDLAADPLTAMFFAIVSVGMLYYLFTSKLLSAQVLTDKLLLKRFRGSCWALLIITVLAPLFVYTFDFYPLCTVTSTGVTLYYLKEYLKQRKYFDHPYLIKSGLLLAVLAVGALSVWVSSVLAALLIALIALVFAIRHRSSDLEYLQLVIQHPARCLIITFLLLSTAGTLLLRTSVAMQSEISVIDAAFTAVSGCCVTGLTVIDIASELTLTGRIFLLILIQLGGLGIMTLTTLALHALGKLSLNQEQLISEMSDGTEPDVFKNLNLIVRFTFVVEFIGACFLTWGFYSVDHNLLKALEFGIFTSVSAFCNAGFFPGTDNLIPYAGENFLLILIALEITLGGIAPAVTWSVLRMQMRRQMPFICKLVIYSTTILLAAGTFLLLLFEWNGIFGNLSIPGKVVNAFFQTASLRTAGFNSVSLENLGIQSYMVMIFLMFVGGSPGGTAGGIKTTTLAVLWFTFRAALRNEEIVTVDSRRFSNRTVIQAVAIVMAAIGILFLIMLMLTATQNIASGKLFFESVSALATTGVSLNTTGLLDAVGKIIIIVTMFIGRVGPLTLFLILRDRRAPRQPGYPQVNIPLG